LGKRRARLGIFEGDVAEGELEIGQVSAMIKSIEPAAVIVNTLWKEYHDIKKLICNEIY
jgi:enoyl-[acyl-carrier protein] reductase II